MASIRLDGIDSFDVFSVVSQYSCKRSDRNNNSLSYENGDCTAGERMKRMAFRKTTALPEHWTSTIQTNQFIKCHNIGLWMWMVLRPSLQCARPGFSAQSHSFIVVISLKWILLKLCDFRFNLWICTWAASWSALLHSRRNRRWFTFRKRVCSVTGTSNEIALKNRTNETNSKETS